MNHWNPSDGCLRDSAAITSRAARSGRREMRGVSVVFFFFGRKDSTWMSQEVRKWLVNGL